MVQRRGLIGYLARMASLLIALSALTIALVKASLVDPLSTNVGQVGMAGLGQEQRQRLADYWGDNQSFGTAWMGWLRNALRGDLGVSLRFNQPVVDVLVSRAGNTVLLMFVAWLLAGLVGFALGMVAETCQGRVVDRVIKAVMLVLASAPAFWFGLVILAVFSGWLGWLPSGLSAPAGVAAADVQGVDRLRHLILPALTLALVGMPQIVLHTREKAIDVMARPYARFAQARGYSRAQVAWRHGVRNVAVPALVVQCASVAEIFGGSVLVEQVFSYPGLGQAAVVAGLGGDADLLVGIAVVSAVIVMLGNSAADAISRGLGPQGAGPRLAEENT